MRGYVREISEKWVLPLPEMAWNIGSHRSESHRSLYISSCFWQWKRPSLSNFSYIAPHHMTWVKSAGAKKILKNLPPSYWSSSRGPGRHQPAPHCWHLRALVKLPRSVPVESLYESEHILPGKKYWEFFDCVGMIGFYIDAEVEICGIF